MYPYVTIFSCEIPTYGLFAMIGGFAAVMIVIFRNGLKKQRFVPNDDIINIAALVLVGILIFAKLLLIITELPLIIKNWSSLMENPSLLLQLLGGGGVFYGGLFGAVFVVILYCKKYKLSLESCAALFTPAIPLFHGFGRLGCFFAGCCWGVQSRCGIAFTHSLAAPNGVPLVPVQLIESAFNFILFAALLMISNRIGHKSYIFFIYLISYSIMRFIIEFFRGDTLRGLVMLSTSQWISLFIIVFAVLYGFRYYCKAKNVNT